MEKNVGGLDKTIRIIIGIVLLIVGIFVPLGTGLRITSFVVAAIALGTAFVGFCPLWKVLGISTCKECKVGNK